MKMRLSSYAVSILALFAAQGVFAAPIYLNDTNIAVEGGAGYIGGYFQ